MIEVLFAKTEASTMRELKKCSEEFKGDPHEVICLDFMLDVGDIRQPLDSKYRLGLITSVHECSRQRAKDKKRLGELEKLKNAIAGGQALRIWYNDSPYALCGLHYACHMIGHQPHQIFTVKLPDEIMREDGVIIEYRNWGEVVWEQYAPYLIYEKELTSIESDSFCRRWEELKEDNSPLRAIINGELVGVQEDFYDYFIRKCLAKRACLEVELIGQLIGCFQRGPEDWWYARRIGDMIERGVIQVIGDREDLYGRFIQIR